MRCSKVWEAGELRVGVGRDPRRCQDDWATTGFCDHLLGSLRAGQRSQGRESREGSQK